MEGLRTRLLSACLVLAGYLSPGKADEGQGFVEYVMIIGLIALGLSLALIAFRNQISNALSQVGTGV